MRAELPISKSVGSVGNFILRLSTVDDLDVPTNTVLASATIANLSVPEGESTLNFTFANPASVTAGTPYALVLTRPGTNFLSWFGQRSNICTGRTFSSPSETAEFTEYEINFDLNFATFVSS